MNPEALASSTLDSLTPTLHLLKPEYCAAQYKIITECMPRSMAETERGFEHMLRAVLAARFSGFDRLSMTVWAGHVFQQGF